MIIEEAIFDHTGPILKRMGFFVFNDFRTRRPRPQSVEGKHAVLGPSGLRGVTVLMG
jgi:hypothetical protein